MTRRLLARRVVRQSFAVYDCVDDYSSLTFYTPAEQALAARRDREAAIASRLVFAATSDAVRTASAPESEDVSRAERRRLRALLSGRRSRLRGAGARLARAPRDRVRGQLHAREGRRRAPGRSRAARPDWTLLLIGPAEESARAVLERITAAHPNARWLGPKPYEELPHYVAAFDVALCPNQWNDYGRSCFPLKLYEYLAAGKPVIASGNPDLAGMEPDVRLARGVAEFVAAIEEALGRRSAEDKERRLRVASENTWESRASRLLGLVQAELGLDGGAD